MVHRRAWLLVTASLLGLCARGGAQELPPSAGPVLPAVSHQLQDDAEAFARLVEMQVALGWLADPAVFPHPLRARVHEGVLQVQGMVPDDATRERVVAIAHACGKIRVEDQLGRCPPSMPVPHGDAGRLPAAIQEAFKSDWAERVHELSMRSDELGLIAVRGSVPSLQEKLAVSQHLSQLPGCRAVKNDLQVWQLDRGGAALVLVSADGSLTVPVHALTSGMRMVQTPAFVAAQPLLRAEPRPIGSMATSPMPVQQQAAGHEWRPPTLAERWQRFWARTRTPATMPTNVVYFQPAATEAGPVLAAEPQPEFMNRALIVSRELPARRPEATVVQHRTLRPARRPSFFETMAMRWQAWRSGGVAPLPTSPPAGLARSEPRLIPIPAPAATTLPQRTFPEVAPVATTSPTAQHHVVYAAPQAVEPNLPRVVHATGAATPIAAGHRSSTGQAEACSSAARPKSPVEQQLEELIATMCGQAALGVDVVEQSASSVIVCVRVRDAATARGLADFLLKQPELSRWRVYLKMQVIG